MSQCEAAESSSQVNPQVIDGKERSPLDEVLRQGARQMLVKAAEAEVTAYIETHQHEVDQDGRRLVGRNGHARERTIVSGVGQLKIQAPRVDDRRVDEQGRRFRFTSQILPPYLRRTKSVEELIPWLYLKGISTGDFSEALEALLGPDAPGLSATTVVGLKDVWRREYEAWSKRDLSGQRFVYIWADGIYSNVRLDDERQCLLVVMGALEDGRKQLLAVHDGFRESELSWQELLEDLKRQGLELPPKLAVGDGAMGFGRHCGKSIRRPVSNAAGSTRRPTCSISCRRACRAKPSRRCATSILPRVGRRRRPLWTVSRTYTRRSFPKRSSAWKKTAKCCWLSTTFRPSTGGTCGRRTRSSPPLRRSVCGSDERRVVAAAKRR